MAPCPPPPRFLCLWPGLTLVAARRELSKLSMNSSALSEFVMFLLEGPPCHKTQKEPRKGEKSSTRHSSEGHRPGCAHNLTSQTKRSCYQTQEASICGLLWQWRVTTQLGDCCWHTSYINSLGIWKCSVWDADFKKYIQYIFFLFKMNKNYSRSLISGFTIVKNV